MPEKSTDSPNTIKYSIWDTRTNENQLASKAISPELKEKTILESNTKDNQE